MSKEENQSPVTSNFIQEIKEIILTARTKAVRSVDFCRVQMYWQMGTRIFEEEHPTMYSIEEKCSKVGGED